MPDIDIAPLPDDFERWDELLALIMRSFAYMDGVIDPPSSAHRLTPEGLRLKASAETGFIATSHDRLIGCIFAVERGDVVYVGKLAVDESMRGHGIARKLMLAAEHFAIERGKPVLELQSRVELAANHRTFARLGFVEFERTAHDGFDRPTSITFRKALT